MVVFTFYLGIFLKVYCIPDILTWAHTSVITFAPFFLIYAYKVLQEWRTSQRARSRLSDFSSRIAKQRDSFQKFLHSKGAPEESQTTLNTAIDTLLQTHYTSTCKLDFGLFCSLVLVPGFFYGFWLAFCLRLDGEIGTNLFIILIPMWILAIPLFAYAVLNGVAAQNQAVSKFNRVLLSAIVPTGFLVSAILAILKIEGVIRSKLTVLLMPEFFSLICLYIYIQCLTKQVKIHAKP